MTAIHLHLKAHVGTTYKRALERFHQSRDTKVPTDFSTLRLIDARDNWSVLAAQQEDGPLRKPRDFDAELKALGDKARQLKDRKLVQLGELVIAAGVDALPVEQLAGALLAAVETKDAAIREAWRKRGAAFFQGTARNTADGHHNNARSTEADNGGASPGTGQDRA